MAQGLFPPPLLPREHASLQQQVQLRVRDWREQLRESGPETQGFQRVQEEYRLPHVEQAGPTVHQLTQMLGQEILCPRVGCLGRLQQHERASHHPYLHRWAWEKRLHPRAVAWRAARLLPRV